MENFYIIHECENTRLRVLLDLSNKDLANKIVEINRNSRTLKKFLIVIEAVKKKVHNKTQYNWEADCNLGRIYAIKVDSHRFYTLQIENEGWRELYICRYAKKESQKNTKKIDSTIKLLEIQKILCDGK